MKESDIANRVNENPMKPMRAPAREMQIDGATIWCVMNENNLKIPYVMRTVEGFFREYQNYQKQAPN